MRNIALLFIGCIVPIFYLHPFVQAMRSDADVTFCDENYRYCLSTSIEFKDAQWGKSIGASGKKVDHMASNLYPVNSEQHAGIEIYHLQESSCPPPNFGISNYTKNKNGMMWGRVDYWDRGPGFPPEPLCRPPVVHFDVDSPAKTYGFCAEKDDRTVLICISQMTDNPSLASQIFSSFRWIEPTDIFHDLPAKHAQATAISYVKDQNIVEGYPDGTFRPDNPINRAEFTKIVVGAVVDDEEIESSDCFPDVSNEWFAKYVCTAKEQELIKGYPDGSFKPEGTINFVEAAKIISGAFSLDTSGDDETWYKPYVEALAGVNAIPVSIESFDQEITRGEMADIIYRLHANKTDLPSRIFDDLQ